jgi:hypothetical protein
MKWCLVWLLCLGNVLAGCTDKFSLIKISRGTWHQEERRWNIEQESRPPRTPKEEQIVTAAEKRQTLKTVESTYGYLGTVDDDKIVVVFEENRFSPDQFAPKPVERYLVRSGRIRGVLATVEALPDLEFEKAVYNAARNARNESRFAVLLVQNWRKPLTMKASLVGSCTIEVDVIDGLEPYGQVLCKKQVNFCFQESD